MIRWPQLEPVLWAFLASAAIALVATPLAGRIAGLVGAIDTPEDDRRIHETPTPRMGGIAMYLSLLAGTLLFAELANPGPAAQIRVDQMVVVLVCAGLVTVLGAIDDILELRWWVKLGGQIAAAVGVILGPLALEGADRVSQLVLPVQRLDPPFLAAGGLPTWLAVGLPVLWIVALMNMVNFIDGVDGLAGGVCAISSATFALIALSYTRVNVAVLAAATCGAAIGFLRYNFRKSGATIFMGDAGSMLLGFLLAVISIQGVLKTAAAISLVIPLAMLAVPILDTSFVVMKRMKYSLPVSNADRWHLHHRLLNVGYSARRVTLAFWGWTASMSAVAIALRFVDYGNSNHWEPRGLALIGIISAIALAISVYIAIMLEIIKTRAVRERNARIAAARAAERATERTAT